MVVDCMMVRLSHRAVVGCPTWAHCGCAKLAACVRDALTFHRSQDSSHLTRSETSVYSIISTPLTSIPACSCVTHSLQLKTYPCSWHFRISGKRQHEYSPKISLCIAYKEPLEKFQGSPEGGWDIGNSLQHYKQEVLNGQTLWTTVFGGN